MKVAIIHDWLVSYGGGESVVLKLHEIFPNAPIYTSVYDKNKMEKYFKNIDIRTSFIQKLPFALVKHRYYLPLMPLAFEQFDLSEYDLVISSSSCCAKGVNVNSNTLHICYCHTPMRYAWDMYNAYNNGFKLKQMYIAKEMHKLRQWDFVSSNRVDYFIANSNYIAKRIKKHYRRNATVIYPGVNNEFYKVPIIKKTEEFYLVVSRLVSYKKIDIIIKTFNELKKPLIIVGDGPERKKLQKMANKNIEFKGYLNNREVISLYQKCKAFVYTAEEDFGIVIAEAQAMGKPVVAYGKGGATEIVKQDTGILFNEQNEKCLKEAVMKMEKSYKNFIPEKIRENEVKFSEEKFKKNLEEFIKLKYNEEKYGFKEK